METNPLAKKLNNLKEGNIFFPSDFTDKISSTAVRKFLSRIALDGKIMRLAHGIYCVAGFNSTYGFRKTPHIDIIAKRVAERDHVKIIPAGDFALNMLGLSTQVPLNAVYITNGGRKKIKLDDGRNIIFRESNDQRMFTFRSELMVLCVSAMKTIGKDNLTAEQLNVISEFINKVGQEDYEHDLCLSPEWIRKILRTNRDI